MSVIEGSSVSCKTMSDGTLRISIDIEPANAQAAFALFGAPGRAIALAALKDGSGAVKEPEPEKPKGGEWAKLAGMWCNDPDFWEWINSTTHEGIFWDVKNDIDAAVLIRELCLIQSRAELDHDRGARHLFSDRIRMPFMAWMKANGIQK
jgi:hypothetical protein